MHPARIRDTIMITEKRMYSVLRTVIVVLICTAFSCCTNKRDDMSMLQLSQTGNFVVTNVSTGTSITVYSLEEEYTMFEAKNGETIKLQYVPNKDYTHLNYHVNFTLQDQSVHTATAPKYSYEYNIEAVEVGSYPIFMSALINEDGVQVTSFASFTLVIKE